MESLAWNRLFLLLVAAAAAEGLIAVWAATSRAHWFVRALAVWGGVMLLIPVRVYELALMFAIAGPLTVSWLLLARRLRRHGNEAGDASADRGGVRYGVRDLLLMMVLVGLVIVGLQLNPATREFAQRDWLACFMTGALLSATVALAALLVLGRSRLATLVTLAAAVAAGAWAIPRIPANSIVASTWLVFVPPSELLRALFPDDGSGFENKMRVATRLAEVAVVVATFVGLAVLAGRPIAPRWRWSARTVLGIATLMVAIPLTWLYWQMLWLTPLPPPITAPVNHYPRLTTIADALEKMGPVRLETKNLHQSLIAEAVDLSDAPSFVVWDLERDAIDDEVDRHYQTKSSLHDLGASLETEFEAAVMRGDYARARELAVANIRLGVMLNRGGTVHECFVGCFLNMFGQRKLAKVRAQLAPDEARTVLAELQRALAEVEDEDTIALRDRAIQERAYGWQTRLESIAMSLASESYATAQDVDGALRYRNTRNLLLQADLAARLFNNEQGRWPASLEELVPEYLPAVPLDPYSESGQPLRHRAEADGFVLYSVGMDGTDDGGKFGNSQTYYQRGYDYDLDTHSRP